MNIQSKNKIKNQIKSKYKSKDRLRETDEARGKRAKINNIGHFKNPSQVIQQSSIKDTKTLIKPQKRQTDHKVELI